MLNFSGSFNGLWVVDELCRTWFFSQLHQLSTSIALLILEELVLIQAEKRWPVNHYRWCSFRLLWLVSVLNPTIPVQCSFPFKAGEVVSCFVFGVLRGTLQIHKDMCALGCLFYRGQSVLKWAPQLFQHLRRPRVLDFGGMSCVSLGLDIHLAASAIAESLVLSRYFQIPFSLVFLLTARGYCPSSPPQI